MPKHSYTRMQHKVPSPLIVLVVAVRLRELRPCIHMPAQDATAAELVLVLAPSLATVPDGLAAATAAAAATRYESCSAESLTVLVAGSRRVEGKGLERTQWLWAGGEVIFAKIVNAVGLENFGSASWRLPIRAKLLSGQHESIAEVCNESKLAYGRMRLPPPTIVHALLVARDPVAPHELDEACSSANLQSVRSALLRSWPDASATVQLVTDHGFTDLPSVAKLPEGAAAPTLQLEVELSAHFGESTRSRRG